MPSFLRGALPSPRHSLAAAFPHRVVTLTPPQFIWKPARLSLWGNSVYGDCTVAEEAFAKGATAGLFITDEEVVAWAQQNGAINGDTLIDVLTKMRTGGFPVAGKTYDDGPATSIDWMDATILQNAISHGPVKTGVAADQLQNVVTDPPTDGWFATGFVEDRNLDHCVSLCGYGPVKWLADQLGVHVPEGADPETTAYALFTWGSIGIITLESAVAITGEAWLRNPCTIVK